MNTRPIVDGVGLHVEKTPLRACAQVHAVRDSDQHTPSDFLCLALDFLEH